MNLKSKLNPFLTPYFEAAKTILKGIPVNNLEEIRIGCNIEYHKAMKKFPKQEYTTYKNSSKNNLLYQTGMDYLKPNFPSGLNPKDILLSYVTDAENQILMGTDPVEAYKLSKNPIEDRKKCRDLLEWMVDEHFKMVNNNGWEMWR